MAKLGLFGGTFNPLHIGHLMIAEEARIARALDEVVLIPAGDPYLKDPGALAPKEARLEMARLAAALDPAHLRVSDIEIRREGPSYTFETLEAFRRVRPGDRLFLILGADSLLEIESWKCPERIFAAAAVLAVARGGQDPAALRAQAANLRRKYGAEIDVLAALSLTISSSDLRGRLRRGEASRYLLPEPVYQYIRTQGLYGCCETPQEAENGQTHGL